MRVPPVDPTRRRPIRKTLVEPVARSGVGRWWLIHASPKLDPFLYRISGGRITSLPMPVLFLTHTGARSGRRSRTPLVYFTDGEDAIVIASNYGRAKNPAWYHNVKANPEVGVGVAGRECRYRAEVVTDDERERLWPLAVQFTEVYADYVRRAEGRTIQLVRLSPLEPA
jgi:deazaflavin-dependent oxidoreductase (nitroreductase family)